MGEKILIGIIGAVVGGVITIFSKIIWDRKIQKRTQRQEDRNIFVQIVEVLSDLIAPVQSGKSKNTSHENFNELEKLYSMIQCEENRDLADEIQAFVQENRGYDAVSYKALRGKIESLKSKVLDRI